MSLNIIISALFGPLNTHNIIILLTIFRQSRKTIVSKKWRSHSPVFTRHFITEAWWTFLVTILMTRLSSSVPMAKQNSPSRNHEILWRQLS